MGYFPVPHTAVCPQGTKSPSESLLAPSLPEDESKEEDNDNTPPAVVRQEPEQPKPVSACFGWHCL